ncbi:MAG: hypothetical protein JSR96_03430 [Proteobacteria bacterium]|nr:hypothetical protein [Pseudomonadota bacterium]
MRRQSQVKSLPPELLRQFAIITLIITAVIAMFANGEQAKIKAMVEAREAKSRLATAEAEKLGKRKLGAAFKDTSERSGPGFERLNDSSNVNSPPPPAPSSEPRRSGPGSMPHQPELITLRDGRKGMAMEFGPDGKPRPIKKNWPPPRVLTPAEIKVIQEQARLK